MYISIPGYNGRYCFDEYGFLYSCFQYANQYKTREQSKLTIPEKKLKRQKSKSGNVYYVVTYKKKSYNIRAPKVVYNLFIGEYDEDVYYISHIDGDKNNCAKDNLSLIKRHHLKSSVCKKHSKISNDERSVIADDYSALLDHWSNRLGVTKTRIAQIIKEDVIDRYSRSK